MLLKKFDKRSNKYLSIDTGSVYSFVTRNQNNLTYNVAKIARLKAPLRLFSWTEGRCGRNSVSPLGRGLFVP